MRNCTSKYLVIYPLPPTANHPVNLPKEPDLMKRIIRRKRKPTTVQPTTVQPTTVQPTPMKPPPMKPTTVPFSRVINLLYNDHLSIELSPPGIISSAKPSILELLEILSLLEKDQSDTMKFRASRFLLGVVKYDLFQTLLHHSAHLETLLRGVILILKETSRAKTSEITKQYMIAILMVLSRNEELRALITTHRLQHELIDSLLFNLEAPPSVPTTLGTKDDDDDDSEDHPNLPPTLAIKEDICRLFKILVYKQDGFKEKLHQVYGQSLNAVLANIWLQVLVPDPNLSMFEQEYLTNICWSLHFLNVSLNDNQQLLDYKYGALPHSAEFTTSEFLEIVSLLTKDNSDTTKLRASKALRILFREPTFQNLLRDHHEHLDTLLRGGILILKDPWFTKISESTKRYMVTIFTNLSIDNQLRALITTHHLRRELIDSLLFNLEDFTNLLTTLATKDSICKLFCNLVYQQDEFKKELQQIYGQRLIAVLANMRLHALVPDLNLPLSNDERTCLKSVCSRLRYLNINQNSNKQLLVYKDKSGKLTESVEFTTFEVLDIVGLLKENHSDTTKLRASKVLRILFREPTFLTLLHQPKYLETLLTGGIRILKETSLSKISAQTKRYMIDILIILSRNEELRALITTQPSRRELIDSLLFNLEDFTNLLTTLATKDSICKLFCNLVYQQDEFKKEMYQVYGQSLIDTVLNMLQSLLPVINDDQDTCIEHICWLLGSLNSNQDFNQQLYAYQKVPLLKMLLTLLNPKDTAKLTESTRLTVYKLLTNLIFKYDQFLEDITHHYNSLTIQAIITILNEYDQSTCKLSLAQEMTVLLKYLLNHSSFRKHLTPDDFQNLKNTLSNILVTKQYPEFKGSLGPILQLLEEKQDVNSFTKFLTSCKFSFTFSSKPSGEATEPSEKAAENEQLSASP